MAASVWPVPPGSAHRVGHYDGDGDTEQCRAPGRAAPPRSRRDPRAVARVRRCRRWIRRSPEAACTMPSRFSVMRVRPLRASTRTASWSTSRRRSASRSSGSVGRRDDPSFDLGDHLAGDHEDVAVGSSHGAAPTMAAARSSPGRNSGSPVTGRISMGPPGAWSRTDGAARRRSGHHRSLQRARARRGPSRRSRRGRS